MSDVVISGIGVVSPLGHSIEELAARVFAGASAVAPLRALPGRYGAVIEDIPLASLPAEARARVGRLDRISRLFVSAAFLAVDSARLQIAPDADRVGVSFGTGLGCLLTDAEYHQKLLEPGAAASPRLFAATVSNAAAGEVSIALGVTGPNTTVHAGFAAGLSAISYGCDLIRMGKADVVLAGGADALGGALLRGLADMGVLKRVAGARPFRDMVPGVYPSEAAAVLVLERGARARQRGARCWARVAGYAAGFEPTLTRAERHATGIAATIERAIVAADCGRAVDVAITSAHATVLDDIERTALQTVLDVPAPLLLAPKMAWGECFGAHGALACALGSAVLAAPPVRVADNVGFRIDQDRILTAPDPGARFRDANLAMVHALCYSGPSVALLLAREN